MAKKIQQSNFKFDLNDHVVIAKPVGVSQGLKGARGTVIHRGYHDYANSWGSAQNTNLYAILTIEGEQVNGMPEGWLEADLLHDILQET